MFPSPRVRLTAALTATAAALTFGAATWTTQAQAAAPLASFDFEQARYAGEGGSAILDNDFRGKRVRQHGGVLPNINGAHRPAGQHGLQTSIKAGSTYSRSEFAFASGVPNGQTAAYSFDMYIPTNHDPLKEGRDWMMFSQTWQTSCGSPAVALRFKPGTQNGMLRYEVAIRNNKTTWYPDRKEEIIYSGVVKPGAWTRFTVEYTANPTRPGTSSFALWQGGYPKVKKTGIDIGYSTPDGKCRTKGGDPYLINNAATIKVGIYRGGNPLAHDANLFFDNVKYGRRAADLAKLHG